MDQSELRRFEELCIQEEPPWCQASCPLHLDGRALCRSAAGGQFTEARRTIEKTLPLPEILGRICDAPCMGSCLRALRGGAVALGDLERACLDEGPLQRRALLIPKNGRSFAVAGGALSALTAASDGLRKGFSVTVLTFEEPKDLLLALSDRLAPEVVQRELNWLASIGAVFRPFPAGRGPDDVASEFEALYIGLDDPCAAAAALGIAPLDPVSLETGRPGLFAGGDGPSFIQRAAEGRRGATSIERFLQGASLHSGREKEGPFTTRLFTDISAVESLSPTPAPPGGYDAAGAKEEAARCLRCQCMECVKRCVYLQEYRGYPKRYAREIYNNLAIVQGSRTANGMINSCSLCGQCERICPNGFSMRGLCLGARREMVRQDRMPPSAHDFALEDMAFSNSAAALLRHAPGRETSSYLFFPGCRLAGSSPGTIAPLYDFLRDRIDGVGLWIRCCGAPARWAGREDLFGSATEELKGQWAFMGSPTVIAACTGCLDVLRRDAPEIEAVSLWAVLNDIPLPPHPSAPEGPVALHDPCPAAEMPDVRAAVRAICSALGITVDELPETGERTSCCGFGGLQRNANEPLADRAATARVEESPRDYLTYCAMCRNLFARAGKRTAHLLDFLFPEPGMDPFHRPFAGYSRQRDDRLALVRALHSTHWMEDNRPMEPHESVTLVMDGSVLALLEKRRIVHDAVKRVLYEAERTGRSVDRGDGTFIASLRPSLVTYWIEYRPLGDGRYEVLGAWSHRMVVTEGGRRS